MDNSNLPFKNNNYEIRGDHVAIFLKRRNGESLVTLVDLDDLERIISKGGVWGANHAQNTGSYYAVFNSFRRSGRAGNGIGLHRFVMNAPRGIHVDHVNHDTLDNRKLNLRLASRVINGLNRKNPEAGIEQTESGRWRISITFRQKFHLLGTADTHEEALLIRLGAKLLAESIEKRGGVMGDS